MVLKCPVRLLPLLLLGHLPCAVALFTKDYCLVAGSTTSLKPSAILCDDSTAPQPGTSTTLCEATFGPFNPDPLALADARCDISANPANAALLPACRKTCKLCCALPQFDACADTYPTAPAAGGGTGPFCDVNQCGVDDVYRVKLCPSTCGRCQEHLQAQEATKFCDNVADTNNCITMKEQGLCSNSDILEICALTCNPEGPNNQACIDYTDRAIRDIVNSTAQTPPAAASAGPAAPGSAGAAGDLSADCSANRNLCANPVYRDFMQQFCRATCASSSAGGARCTDRAASCVNWKRNGFCENQFYPLEKRREECGGTCGASVGC